MMKEKEEYLRLLDFAYRRIVITCDGYETDSFANILVEGTNDDRKSRIDDFFKTYQEKYLFVNYETLLSYFDGKEILRFILHTLKETDFYLYLCASESNVGELKENLDAVYFYCKGRCECVCEYFEDNGYVIEIRDNRYSNFSVNNYFRIYPNGQGILITDSDYHIEKINIAISDDVRKELFSVVKKRVKEEIKQKYKFVVDDREFLKSFVVTYGFEWLGYQCEWGMDNQDYFLKKYPSEIIEKVMNIPIIKEKFVNANIPYKAKECFEADI